MEKVKQNTNSILFSFKRKKEKIEILQNWGFLSTGKVGQGG